jgi:two-component system sensor histidine kinase/response regulator
MSDGHKMNHNQKDTSRGDILVVDDTPVNLSVLSGMLTNQGFKVRKSLNGKGAIASVKAGAPDVILLDVRMPEMDGYEVCQLLRDDPDTRNIPIIFISALDDISSKIKAFESGGVDYITKPFQKEEVLARVENQIHLQRLQRQLMQQNEELVRSNRELEQFAYLVSHDLQQPLQSMMGFAQLVILQYQNKLDETANNYLNGIIHAGDRTQRLIQDLLAYAQVGKQNHKFESVDCNLVLKKVLNNFQTEICKETVNLTRDSLPVVIGNETQLIQLFQNLIGNAIKFIRPGVLPQVEISATKQDDEWLFQVRDNGIGMEPQNLDCIFEVFQRLHTSEQYPGTGIGLAICRKIVEIHGGHIWVESQPNVGTTFYFTWMSENVTSRGIQAEED